MATINIDLIKKGQLGQLDKFFETNSFVSGVVVSAKDKEIFDLINNGFDQKKNKHVARWYNYYRQLAPSVLAALPADGVVVLSASSASSSSSSSSSSSGSSSSGSSSSGSSDDEAEKKRKAKAARQQAKIDAEQSTVVIDVEIRYADPNLDEIAAQIRAIERESLIWSPGHEGIAKGYGRFTLRIGCTITNIKVDTDDLLGEIEELNEDQQFNASIISFQKI